MAVVDPHLTRPDFLVLGNLLEDIEESQSQLFSTAEFHGDAGYYPQSSNGDTPNPLQAVISSRFSSLVLAFFSYGLLNI